MPFSASWAADDLESRLKQLDAELGRQGETIREQQKAIEVLREELAGRRDCNPNSRRPRMTRRHAVKESRFFALVAVKDFSRAKGRQLRLAPTKQFSGSGSFLADNLVNYF